MYAIIDDNGRQLKVTEGERVQVDLRAAQVGDVLEFDKVIFLGGEEAQVGAPYIANAKVRGEVEGEIKDEKVIAFKYRRRENYHRKVGHRQRYLQVRITQIVAG